jgi:hypothetical protein
MQMYLFAGAGSLPNVRAVSGADDAAVVYNEYVHGLSGRLVTDANGGNGLPPQAQPGALGEAWSDYYAMDYLVNQGFQADSGAPGEVVLSVYESLTPTDFRSQPLDCPVGSCPGTAGAGPGGYTFGDYGKILGQPEVHADGEIWSETLWDLRAAVGTETAQSLVTGGLRLTPPIPTFLQARDAILQQAQVVGGTDLQQQAWQVFAARGMGAGAFTSGPEDNAPVESFDVPAPPVNPSALCNGRAAGVVGTGAAERIKGTNRSDVIAAGGGNDRVNGNSGRDVICGGPGRDRIAGGGGNDLIIGGGGRDTCIGGGGKDKGRGCERK